MIRNGFVSEMIKDSRRAVTESIPRIKPKTCSMMHNPPLALLPETPYNKASFHNREIRSVFLSQESPPFLGKIPFPDAAAPKHWNCAAGRLSRSNRPPPFYAAQARVPEWGVRTFDAQTRRNGKIPRKHGETNPERWGRGFRSSLPCGQRCTVRRKNGCGQALRIGP